MNEIAWVLFDLGGVVLRVDQSKIFNELARISMRSPHEIKARLEVSPQFWAEFVIKECTPQELAQQVNTLLGTSLPEEDIQRAFNAELGSPIESTCSLLPVLRQKIAIGCLSNTNSIHWQHMLCHYEMMQHFDRRFASQLLGYAKPNDAIYQRVSAHLGVRPAQILFFDDREENVAAATRLGWNACLYDGHEGLLGELRRFGLTC